MAKNPRRTSGVRVWAALSEMGAKPMSKLIEVPQAVALMATITRTLFEIREKVTAMRREHKHDSG